MYVTPTYNPLALVSNMLNCLSWETLESHHTKAYSSFCCALYIY